MNITLKLRVALTMALLSVLLLLIGGFGLAGMASSNDVLSFTYSNRMPGTIYIADAELSLQRERAALLRAAMNPADPKLPSIISHSRDYRTEARQSLEKYMALAHAAQGQAQGQELLHRRADMDAGIDEFANALLSQDPEKINRAALKNNDLYAAYHDTTVKLRAYQYGRTKESFEAQQQSFATFRIVTFVAMAIGLLASVVSYITLSRAISRPVSAALSHFERIAGGDLTKEIRTMSRDEMGQVLQGLANMQERLLQTVKTVRTSSEAIVSATQQVAAGNADLSARTEQQAASLQETAASMEELTSTVKHNADNAQQASQLAATARQVSGNGAKIVGEVVATMTEIGESSNKISDITGLIEGIAFQTNILALNAAVEAARAGEHGRGFAVVASEVRSLAQRSSTAAKEIKDLIGASVDRVHHGADLVMKAGDTMGQIKASIERVHDIVGEIAAASGEQSRGIEQVNQAISQMDDVTQQNAALVEQAAAAAGSLNDQAQALSAAVVIFKTGAGGNSALASQPVEIRAPEKRRAPATVAPKRAAVQAERSTEFPAVKERNVAPATEDWTTF
jgi:methyl-accepting chemotaxis protein I, serine sensor receptor